MHTSKAVFKPFPYIFNSLKKIIGNSYFRKNKTLDNFIIVYYNSRTVKKAKFYKLKIVKWDI